MKKLDAHASQRSDSGDCEALAVVLFCLASVGGSAYLIWHFYHLLERGFRCYSPLC